MKLRLTTTNDLNAVMTIINQAKKYFKEHREEFWENPEYYGQFGRIHNNQPMARWLS